MVTALSTIKGAEKLFARAWATSGGIAYPNKLLSEYESENERFLTTINCKDVQCLRNTDAAVLTNSIEDTWRKPHPDLPSTKEANSSHNWLVLDGKILQDNPSIIWENGLIVKLVLGSTAHAAATEKLLKKHKFWSEDLVSHHVRNSVLGKFNLSEHVLEMYPKTFIGLSQMISDFQMICPLLAISTRIPNSTFYVVTQVRGENNISDVDSDIDAILGRYEPKTPEQRRYFSAIQQLFYQFVWHGKMTTEKSGNKVLIINQDIEFANNYSKCEFWQTKNLYSKT